MTGRKKTENMLQPTAASEKYEPWPKDNARAVARSSSMAKMMYHKGIQKKLLGNRSTKSLDILGMHV